ncbi:unnamed protein product [Lasius platythorax]|uniref:Uncharacterized protein n=1 Tax=Lasius platythorax TaxID=488582 RepID=A0AAV2P326_9HYME
MATNPGYPGQLKAMYNPRVPTPHSSEITPSKQIDARCNRRGCYIDHASVAAYDLVIVIGRKIDGHIISGLQAIRNVLRKSNIRVIRYLQPLCVHATSKNANMRAISETISQL